MRIIPQVYCINDGYPTNKNGYGRHTRTCSVINDTSIVINRVVKNTADGGTSTFWMSFGKLEGLKLADGDTCLITNEKCHIGR